MSNFKIRLLVNCFILLICGVFTIPVIAAETPHVEYAVHVENLGWQDPVEDGTSAGTTGSSLRQEAVKISIVDDSGNHIDGLGVTYRSHVQDEGWQGYVSDGAESGTTGQAKKVEAVQIKLTGDKANQYNIAYRTHVENFGWTGWTVNGNPSGSEGFNYRLEAIEIKLIPSTETVDSGGVETFYSNYGKGNIRYQAHVENVGWQNYVNDDQEAGSTGQNLKLEALIVSLNPNLPEGDILISPHVQDIGWMEYVPSYQLVGTTGQNKRLEALKIRLTGELADLYTVQAQAHVQDIGWMNPVGINEIVGTTGQGLKIEAVKLNLIPKDDEASSFISLSKKSSDLIKKYDEENKNINIDNPYSSKRILVSLKSGDINPSEYGAIDYIKNNNLYIIQFNNEEKTKNALNKLKSLESVEYAYPDCYLKSDSSNDESINALAGSGFLSWGVKYSHCDEFAEKINNKNDMSQRYNTLVAVIDTGVSPPLDFGDLHKRMYYDGWDFVDNDGNADDEGKINGLVRTYHGTHVAGIITDCTPDLNISILPIRVLPTWSAGSLINTTSGIYYAVDHGADVINMSLGGQLSEGHEMIDMAIQYAINHNVVVCVSAGNDHNYTGDYCPSHLNEAIVVTAINNNGQLAQWSDGGVPNYGDTIDIAAPGQDIESYSRSDFSFGQKTTVLSGTSMACPHVAAAAAMLKMENSSRTPQEIENLLKDNARDTGAEGFDNTFGAGILDLHNLAKPSVPDTGVDEPDNPPESTEKELILECPDTIEMHVGETIEIPVTLLPNNSGFNATVKDFNGGGVGSLWEEEWKKYIDYHWLGGDMPTNEYFDVEFFNLNSGEQNAYVRIHSKKQYYLGVPSVGNKFTFRLGAFYFDGKFLSEAADVITIISQK